MYGASRAAGGWEVAALYDFIPEAESVHGALCSVAGAPGQENMLVWYGREDYVDRRAIVWTRFLTAPTARRLEGMLRTG